LDQGDMAGAVEAAWRVLRDLLRQRLGSHKDGRALVDDVGQARRNPRLPLTPNRTPSQTQPARRHRSSLAESRRLRPQSHRARVTDPVRRRPLDHPASAHCHESVRPAC
jgi:hypothetical protein